MQIIAYDPALDRHTSSRRHHLESTILLMIKTNQTNRLRYRSIVRNQQCPCARECSRGTNNRIRNKFQLVIQAALSLEPSVEGFELAYILGLDPYAIESAW